NTLLTPTFVDNTVNPATMQNYSPDISGILSLTVTDDNGTGSSTEITYNINEGHFPEGLVIDKEIVGQFDETLAMVDSDGNALGSLDSIAGGDLIDNTTGAFLEARRTFLSSGNQIWTLDNDSSARALPQTFDNGTAMRLENLEWNFGSAFVASDDRAYFQARVYDNATNQYFGDEPVVADSSGVRLLADLRPGSSGSYPSQFIESGSKLFFTARDSSSQNKLYKLSLGTADNVSVVNGSPAYPNYPQDITIDSDTSGGSKVMFSVNNGGPQQIYITDGDNTTELDNVPPFNMWSAKRLDDVMYFVINSELHQLPLSTVRLLQAGETNDNGDVMDSITWTASPSMITPLSSGSINFYDIQKVDGKLYFRIQDSGASYDQRYQWWESDGTAGGSQIIMAGDSNFANILVEQNGEFLYNKTQTDSWCCSGNQLWSTNQTANDNGTMGDTLLATIGSYPNISFQSQLPSGKWFFTADDGTTGRELWVTDGTPAGTMLLKDIYPGTTSGLNNFQSRVVGNLLYFVADDGFSGAELWVSNGTRAGTLKAKEFRTGMAGSDPKFHSLNGDLYVFANDGSGVKLYKKAE
ncbi:MAG: ELWxxDGT repeat protein, partial [SAR324 cluster bacterium]|nr:ELWxxDGT repeat protein [SAR324 cluster bacterium]